MGFLNTVIIDPVPVHLGQTKEKGDIIDLFNAVLLMFWNSVNFFFSQTENCQWDFLTLQLAFKSTKVLLLWTKISLILDKYGP